MPAAKPKPDASGDHEHRLIGQALRALQSSTGLAAAIDPRTGRAGSSGQITLRIGPPGAERKLAARVRRADRFAALAALRNQFAGCASDLPGVLVARQLSSEAAQHCRSLGLQFVDAAGNAHLDQPGLFVFVCGRHGAAPQDPAAAGRAPTASALRIQFALLCRPALLEAPYRQIAAAAGVALGTVGPVLEELRNRGWMAQAAGHGARRQLLGRERLLQDWVLHYPVNLRPKLHAKRFTAAQADWWRSADLRAYGASWSGEAAAALLGAPLQASHAIVYIEAQRERRNLWHLIVDHQLRPDPAGPVEILDRFWNFEDAGPCGAGAPAIAPRELVHADLMAQRDPAAAQAAGRVLQSAPLAQTGMPAGAGH